MGLFDFITSAFTTNQTNKTNIRLAREQQEWSEKMWNLQNEYNTPQNVLNRYIDAGINPNMVVGQVSGGMASQPLNYERAKVNPIPPTNIDQAMGMAYQLKLQKDQLGITKDLASSEVFKNKAEGISKILQQPGIMSDNKIKKLTEDFLKETFESRVKQESERAGLFEWQKYVNVETVENLKKTNQQIDKNIEYIDNQIMNNNKMTEANIEYMEKQAYNGWLQACAAIKSATAAELNADANWLNAETNAKNAEFERRYKRNLAEFVDKQCDLLAQEYNFNEATWDSRIKSLKLDLLYKGEQITFAQWQNTFNKQVGPALLIEKYGQAFGTWQNNMQNSLLFQNKLVGGALNNASTFTNDLPARFVFGGIR